MTIDGLKITRLLQITDGRGAVLHMLRADEPEFTAFGECYFSEINPGMIKAWKRHRRQSQQLAVPIGRVRFVIYDDRQDSPTRGLTDVVELGRPDAYMRLHVPPMLWYGFRCVTELPALVANCVDIPHQASESDAMSLDLLPGKRALELLQYGTVHP